MINGELTLLLNGGAQGDPVDPDYAPRDYSPELQSWLDTLYADCPRADRLPLALGLLRVALLVPECAAALDAAYGTVRSVRTDLVDKSGVSRVYLRLLHTNADLVTSSAPADVVKLWDSGYTVVDRMSAACCLLLLALRKGYA